LTGPFAIVLGQLISDISYAGLVIDVQFGFWQFDICRVSGSGNECQREKRKNGHSGHDKATAETAKSTLCCRESLACFESNVFDTVKRNMSRHQNGRVCKRRPVSGLADGAMARDATQQWPLNHYPGFAATAGATHFIHHSTGLAK
jgi:hypothetical protein